MKFLVLFAALVAVATGQGSGPPPHYNPAWLCPMVDGGVPRMVPLSCWWSRYAGFNLALNDWFFCDVDADWCDDLHDRAVCAYAENICCTWFWFFRFYYFQQRELARADELMQMQQRQIVTSEVRPVIESLNTLALPLYWKLIGFVAKVGITIEWVAAAPFPTIVAGTWQAIACNWTAIWRIDSWAKKYGIKDAGPLASSPTWQKVLVRMLLATLPLHIYMYETTSKSDVMAAMLRAYSPGKSFALDWEWEMTDTAINYVLLIILAGDGIFKWCWRCLWAYAHKLKSGKNLALRYFPLLGITALGDYQVSDWRWLGPLADTTPIPVVSEPIVASGRGARLAGGQSYQSAVYGLSIFCGDPSVQAHASCMALSKRNEDVLELVNEALTDPQLLPGATGEVLDIDGNILPWRRNADGHREYLVMSNDTKKRDGTYDPRYAWCGKMAAQTCSQTYYLLSACDSAPDTWNWPFGGCVTPQWDMKSDNGMFIWKNPSGQLEWLWSADRVAAIIVAEAPPTGLT